MNKKHTGKPGLAGALPMYLFTIIFILGPLLYMLVLSFAKNGGSGAVIWQFSGDNYRRILDPVYLQTFTQSFQLAFTSTVCIVLIGYPFGYFMAKLTGEWKKRVMFLLMIPFWTSALMRLYGWIIILQTRGPLNQFFLMTGLIREPWKMLYSYPVVVFGMIYMLCPFMILAVYSSVEKMDWSLVEASRDLGASRFTAFMTVTLKLTMPGLLSGIILTFVPSMGLFFVADLLGGNKIVLVGSLIQDQLTRGSNWPFAAALAVILMVMTLILIQVYKRLTNADEVEGWL